jgi:5-aminolevulinate synthase
MVTSQAIPELVRRPADDLIDVLTERLRALHDSNSYRSFIASDNLVARPGYADGPDGILQVWCSNDYLGLSQHPAVIESVIGELGRQGLGSGGSRNISGTSQVHSRLELELASWHGMERALLFSSGYAANFEFLSSLRLALPGLVIFSDSLNHRSLIEGIKRHPGRTEVFAHNSLVDLERRIAAYPRQTPKLIVLESIYSMDADLGPITEVCDIAEQYGAMTYVDETHAIGIRGRTGSGLLEELDERRVTFVQGVLGKALGTVGGYVAGPDASVDFVRSTAPGFIFTTSLPPAVIAGTLTALALVRGDYGQLLRDSLHDRVATLKQALRAESLEFLDHDSHFVPVFIRGGHRTQAVAAALRTSHHIYVQAINEPSVARGSERFRLAVGPHRTDAEIHQLVAALTTELRNLPEDFDQL